MVTSYNEKDLLSFGEYVKDSIKYDGLGKLDLKKAFKGWLYHSDKARFTVEDLCSFANHMMERTQLHQSHSRFKNMSQMER